MRSSHRTVTRGGVKSGEATGAAAAAGKDISSHAGKAKKPDGVRDAFDTMRTIWPVAEGKFAIGQTRSIPEKGAVSNSPPWPMYVNLLGTAQ